MIESSLDRKQLQPILTEGEQVLWTGRPHHDSFIVSTFPILSILWGVMSMSAVSSHFSEITLKNVLMSFVITLPTWGGIAYFLKKLYERKQTTLYAVTTKRIIGREGILKPKYMSTYYKSLYSITLENDSIIHSIFQTGSIIFDVGHHEYNEKTFILELKYLKQSKEVFRVLKLYLHQIKINVELYGDPHAGEVFEDDFDKKKKAS